MKAISAIIGSIFLITLVTGCASGVTRDDTEVSQRVRVTPDSRVSEVSVSLTEEAKTKVADNLKFNQEELRDHIHRAMDAKSLLNPQAKGTLPTLHIEIKDFRVRSNFSAVMFGFMAGADSITGDIALKDPSGTELDRFEVSTSYALGGFAGGQDSARMGWLYEKFAEEVVKELTKE